MTKTVRVDLLYPYSSEVYIFTCDYCGRERMKRHGTKTTYYPGSTRKYSCCQGRYTRHTVTGIELTVFEDENEYDAFMVAKALKTLEGIE